MLNLDRLAAQKAQGIVDRATEGHKAGEVDGLATKALGVLQENGVYAATLFLLSRSASAEREIAREVYRGLRELAAAVTGVPAPGDGPEEALRYVSESIAGQLDTLLLVKQVWEQTLIYVRYGAKARGVEHAVQGV